MGSRTSRYILAAADRGKECDLVAITNRSIRAREFLVDGTHQRRAVSRERRKFCDESFEDGRDIQEKRRIHLSLARAGNIGERSKEKNSNAHQYWLTNNRQISSMVLRMRDTEARKLAKILNTRLRPDLVVMYPESDDTPLKVPVLA